jgi:UPF0755 protein
MSEPAAPPSAPLAWTAEPPPPRRRATRGLGISLAVLLIAAGTVIAGARYYEWCQGASGPQRPVTFTVREGASGDEAVADLHEAGVVRCGLVSGWLLRRSGLSDDIVAGEHDLTTNMIPQDAFEALTVAPEPVPTVRLTIPEGYRLTQIADRVEEALGIPARRFLEATRRGWSLPPYLPEGEPLEGFLFPETYEFRARGTTSQDVIERLLAQFEAEAKGLPWQNAEAMHLTPYEIVNVASMIEEEAALDRERPVIAGVIYNRLRDGMSLGIDATLLYDDPTPDGQLSTSDLEYDSPYNTRLHAGLPPTPIASPGLESLRAALEPADTPYFYYVLCGEDGHHRFGRTLAEHEANRAACGE